MKVTAILAAIALLPATVAFAEDASLHMNLNRCWAQDLGGQLQCLQRELEACDEMFEHLSTAAGRYACFDETLLQADQMLNGVYASVIEQAREADREDGMDFREEMVRDSQRKWLVYRDAQSAVKAGWARTGSGHHSANRFEATKLTIIQAEVLSNSVPNY